MRRLYRALLKLYPAGFRENYETSLDRQFRDEYREAATARARASMLLRTLHDLTLSIPTEFARELSQDIRFSLRLYARRPFVTLFAVTALALAIGSATGVFSVVNTVLFRSLPFAEPDRLVLLQMRDLPMSLAEYDSWRTSNRYLQNAAIYGTDRMNLTGAANPLRIAVTQTTSHFFDVTGRPPILGRGFRTGEDQPGKSAVAILSHALWQQSFGANRTVLGSTIRLDGVPFTVIGVAPPGLQYPNQTAIWTPTFFTREIFGKNIISHLGEVGRLKSGVNLQQAAAMFDADVHHSSKPRPWPKEWDQPQLLPLREQLAGPVRQASFVLFGGVLCVLLIACANVANLLLTRASERHKELVLRAALGAGRARLLQQWMTESLLLVATACAAGLLVAQGSIRLATAYQTSDLGEYTLLDWRVLLFCAALVLTTGILFGILPSWFLGRTAASTTLLRSRHSTSMAAATTLRRILVATQVALTLILLTGAAILGRSFLHLLDTDLGFAADRMVTLNISLEGSSYTTEAARRAYFAGVLERLRTVPGVTAAAATSSMPVVAEMFSGTTFRLDSGGEQLAVVSAITPAYLATIGAKLVDGREFLESDRASSEPVAIVNQEFARSLHAESTLLGHKLTPDGSKQPVTIVGIVRDMVLQPEQNETLPQIYFPHEQRMPEDLTFVARVQGDPSAAVGKLRIAAQSIDRAIPIFEVKTISESFSSRLAKPRFFTLLLLFFAAFAVLLSLLGSYAVAAYSIAQRTHEIGVRLAVGSTAGGVRLLLLRQVLAPVALGVAAGIAGSAGLGRVLTHLVESAEPVNAAAIALAASALAISVAAAVWWATERVAKLNPVEILRAD